MHRRSTAIGILLGIELINASPLIGVIEGDTRPYTLEDAYKAADLVTYTSGFEGFGNAFVEAIYHRKPIVVNRYACPTSSPRGSMSSPSTGSRTPTTSTGSPLSCPTPTPASA
jgi:hypothetical protein